MADQLSLFDIPAACKNKKLIRILSRSEHAEIIENGTCGGKISASNLGERLYTWNSMSDNDCTLFMDNDHENASTMLILSDTRRIGTNARKNSVYESGYSRKTTFRPIIQFIDSSHSKNIYS